MLDTPPEGTVTFLFTDVEGSTRMWEEQRREMDAALVEHDRILRAVVDKRNGYVFTTAGDSFSVAFGSVLDAALAALEAQRELAVIDQPASIRVRMGLHTGEASERDGDYFGPALNRAARLMAAGHGGQILLSATTANVIRDGLSDDLVLEDLGEHQLKDLAVAEHIYQLSDADLETPFPPLRTMSEVRHNLPAQLTEFVGREQELAEVDGLLERSRLVTVLAPGGTGKSRLALQVGAEVSDNYRDGVFFVPLAPLSDPEEIPQAIAEAVGISLTAGEDTRTQLLDYFAAKEQLLILDNLEHLREEADLLTEILERAPAVRILSTSRSRLELRGESVFPLTGLVTGWDSPAEALESSGAVLFLNSAQRHDPSFDLQSVDLEALASLLGSLDGMPLAIELAAAWVDVLSVTEIRDEIKASIEFLASDLVDTPDRHHSIRAVFDYSWSTLTDRERDLFAALSVFRGGFTRQAASAVTGADVRDLASLVKKALLYSDRDSGRYSVHELLRQYAEARLEQSPDGAGPASAAHAAYFADMGETLYHLLQSGEIPELLATAEADLDNLRSGWRYLINSNEPALARSYVEGLWLLHEIRGWLPAGFELFGEAPEAIGPEVMDPDARAVAALARCIQGWFAALMGDPQRGLELVEEGTAVLSDVAASSRNMCLAYQTRNINLLFSNPAEIDEWSGRGVEVAQRDGDKWWEMCMLAWRSYAWAGTDSAAGLEYSKVTLPYFRQLGDHWVMVWVLGFLAADAEGRGRFDEARQLYEETLALGRQVGFGRIIQYTLSNLGRVMTATGDFEEARAHFTESLSMSRELGHSREVLASIVDLAGVRAAQGREGESIEMVAAVLSDPVSAQRTIYGRAPIGELAEVIRGKLHGKLDADAYASAWERGVEKGVDGVVDSILL